MLFPYQNWELTTGFLSSQGQRSSRVRTWGRTNWAGVAWNFMGFMLIYGEIYGSNEI